jgi:hypothetical protein
MLEFLFVGLLVLALLGVGTFAGYVGLRLFRR